MALPEFGAVAPVYAIRRRAGDGARKDVLTWGAPAGDAPYATVEIDRSGSEGDTFLDAASEIANRIVGLPVTDDVKAAGEIDSKFGRVALVDFAIAPGGTPRRCLGFTRAFAAPAVQISGWYCSAAAEVIDRGTIACALDRLALVSAGSDPPLAAFFARADCSENFAASATPSSRRRRGATTGSATATRTTSSCAGAFQCDEATRWARANRT